jgi:phytol kinase
MIPLWAGFVLALGSVAATFAALRLWQRRTPSPPPELVRKAAHVATGLVAASLPWLFDRTWPVLALCAASLLGMIAIQTVPGLRRTLGRVTGSVERRSWGEFYLPVAIAAVWWLSGRDRLLYVTPILLLTLGDAGAALVGVALGRHQYRTTEGHKSIEGSLTFWVIGFAVTLSTLGALRPDLPFAKTALIAVVLGGLLMVFEAIAWRGLDNLILPLAALALLKIYLQLDEPRLALRIFTFTAIFGVLLFYRSRMTLIGEGLLAAALFLYGAWALGGWAWLAPPAMVALALPWLPQSCRVPRTTTHGVFSVLSLTGPGLALLFWHTLRGADVWPVYTASFASALSVALIVQLHGRPESFPRAWLLLAAPLVGTALVVPVAAAAARVPVSRWLGLAELSVCGALVASVVAFFPIHARWQSPGPRPLVRGTGMVLGAAASLLLSNIIRGVAEA